MVRLVKIVGVLFVLGFFLWALMPTYNNLVSMANNSTIMPYNMTSLEVAEWRLLLPVLIPAVIIIAIIWRHFSHSGQSGDGGEQ